MAVIQPRPTHILYQCAKCGMWRVRRLTYNNSMAYLKNWTDYFFQIFFMGTSWVAVSINNITTRASREMTSRNNIKIFYFNGMNVAKHWHVAGEVCHLWLPCSYLSLILKTSILKVWFLKNCHITFFLYLFCYGASLERYYNVL